MEETIASGIADHAMIILMRRPCRSVSWTCSWTSWSVGSIRDAVTQEISEIKDITWMIEESEAGRRIWPTSLCSSTAMAAEPLATIEGDPAWRIVR